MHITIDTRPKTEEEKELDAEFIIEIDLLDKGYLVHYHRKIGENIFQDVGSLECVERSEMIERHVREIQLWKPKSVVVRTGRHSTGHVRDIPLLPNVVKLIINGSLTAADLTLRS